MPNTLIFDIGKTNKKCFVLDEKYQEVWKEYVRFEEIKDEDGFPCDDLQAIEKWIKKTTLRLFKKEKFDIQFINFSTYGASFVHIDKDGKVLCPLYNYLKPYPKKVLKAFHQKYGTAQAIAKATASPPSEMLNAGMQLYWLKYTQPKVYCKIRWSLHFPQYLSYLFTGIPVSDFTSIGCHTSLWDYANQQYHQWVEKEELDKKLAPIVATNTSINTKILGKKVAVGVGIHDSSAALIPYLRAAKAPFLLLSTGTWSIALNPFSEQLLTTKDLKKDCLNYLQTNGQPVRASRLFLGNEYKIQTTQLAAYYKIKRSVFKNTTFDEPLFRQLKKQAKNYFALQSLSTNRQQPKKNKLQSFATYKIAYHQLMLELVNEQIAHAERAIANTTIKTIFIDGGFADNDLFIKGLLVHFIDYKIQTTQAPLGSALGAAMIIKDKKIKNNFLKKRYAMKKQRLQM